MSGVPLKCAYTNILVLVHDTLWKQIMFVLPYCVLIHSMESIGCQLGFCWQELSWRMPSRRLSTPQPLTSATPQHWWVLTSQRGSKAKLRHLVWTDNQLFLLAGLLLQHHELASIVWALAHLVWEAQFLLSGTESFLSMSASLWICWTLHFNINGWYHFTFF